MAIQPIVPVRDWTPEQRRAVERKALEILKGVGDTSAEHWQLGTVGLHYRRPMTLAEAMRATMSVPIIFPPVEVDGRVLIDGGTMNNVPADVAKAMGADRVVAVNVGDLSDRGGLNPTMFGIAGSTLDAMMRGMAVERLLDPDAVPTELFEELHSAYMRGTARNRMTERNEP